MKDEFDLDNKNASESVRYICTHDCSGYAKLWSVMLLGVVVFFANCGGYALLWCVYVLWWISTAMVGYYCGRYVLLCFM